MRTFDGPDVFAEAKRIACADLVAACGITLRRSGGRLIGACPLCGGDARSTRFGVQPAANLWICRACGEGGSVIDLEMALRGGEPLDAARRLAGDDGLTRMPPKRSAPDRPNRPRSTAPLAAQLWREAVPAPGTIVEAWLAARGLDVALIAPAIARLRFHPNAFAAGERFGRSPWERRAPAMLAPIIDTNAGGKLIGVHATYLSPDGRAKATLTTPWGVQGDIPARKMWGKAAGGVVALTPIAVGAACDSAADAPPLFVGEGIETTLSALHVSAALGRPIRAAAVLALDNLQGGWLKDAEGAATHWPPKADPERPPWLMLDPGHVVVIVDRDMSPILLKRRDETGAAKRPRLDAEARAQLCADLAVQHWRRARAASVEALLPAMPGCDLNDMLRQSNA